MTVRARLVTAAALVASFVVVGCQRRVDAPAPVSRYDTLLPDESLPEHLRGTILEYVTVFGTTPQVITGYGLVVNLDNTGRDDGIPTPVRNRIAETAARRGLASPQTGGQLGQLTPSALLADPRTSVVRVQGFVPPAARNGQRIDISVEALDTNTTPSLAGGFLWLTELHKGIVGPSRPGEQVNKVGVARGPLLLNPNFVLLPPEDVVEMPAARASLRNGMVPDGGQIEFERPIVLRLRQPSTRMARVIEQRINYHFGRDVAKAKDEAIVELRLPNTGDFSPRGPDDWQNFVGVATHLYLSSSSDYSARQAEVLAEVAKAADGDEAVLLGVSRAWQAMGVDALSAVVPLLTDSDPAVSFYAARTAAHLKQMYGNRALQAIAGDRSHPYNVAAARELGRVPPSTAVRRLTRDLLNASAAGNDQVRIAAYESLLRLGLGQTGVNERAVGDNFILHLTPGDGNPIVYATRTGRPTIAVIGGLRPTAEVPRLSAPLLLSLFGDRLTIARSEGEDVVRMFQREARAEDADARQDGFASVRALPDLREVISRLGGEKVPGERAIKLNYGDVVAVLKELGDRNDIIAGRRGEMVVNVRLQDLADFGNDAGDVAPVVPGLEQRRLGETASADAGQQ